LLLDCCIRVINRTDHATLCGNPSRSISIVIEIFNKFKNFEFNHAFLKKKGIHEIIEMKFVNEVPGIQSRLSDAFLKALYDIVKKYKPDELVPQKDV